ncbi:MAG: hypothetical protein E6J02_00145 [Chloroflexi bacterium]|nr:MAG: hypothetical protein E6J02_00145 [Chloroflexota bacterium]
MVASSTPASAAPASSASIIVKTLSNRADLISGGDALVEIVLPAGVSPTGLAVSLNGRDVSSAFGPRPALGGRVVGLVTGISLGSNKLVARDTGAGGAQLAITNHPSGGPIFAGPQVQPWICRTTSFGLGPSTDAQCDTSPVYTYYYRTSDPVACASAGAAPPCFAPYDPNNPPSNVSTTTTDQGTTVPYVVRRERGVIDRGIYDIAVLFDPHQSWQPWAPQAGWNHKLEVLAGAGCETGHYQDAPAGNVLDDTALSRGFAVLMNEMDDNTQDCNDVVQAEALMMTKEHLIEAYGLVRYTIGQGCSGGSMTQHEIAADYPGLYDGIMPACSFPDIWTTYQEMGDCKLLSKYFDQTSPALWTEAQRASASGHASAGTCEFQSNGRSDSYVSAQGNHLSSACAGNSWTYDPQTNPQGTRCDIQDYEVAVYGKRQSDGFANRPYDNTGVQYGLEALLMGQITPAQFVDLNTKVGGLNIDGGFQAPRAAADPSAVQTAYRTGRVISGAQLGLVPIIDLRGSSNYEEHFDWHTYEFRNRLLRDNGTAANMVYWEGPCCLLTYVAFQTRAFLLMDRWLAAIEADHSAVPQPSKVINDKPADAVDACFIGGQEITDQATCSALLPYYHETRWAAGGPNTADVIKCQLKPINRKDYSSGGMPIQFSDVQWSQLRLAFPAGVCDYTKPGVSQQQAIAPWISFAGGPGGQPLGTAPGSAPI